MDFLTLAKGRCSMRKFANTPVEDAKLNKILEAAHVAPTAGNQQPQRLLVIRSEESLKKLQKGVTFHGAPLAIIVCCDRNSAWVRPFDEKDMVDIDGAIVSDHIIWEAEDLGLSTCWLTYFDPSIIRSEFKIPKNFEPVVILSIGYAAAAKAPADRHSSTRLPLDSIVTYEHF